MKAEANKKNWVYFMTLGPNAADWIFSHNLRNHCIKSKEDYNTKIKRESYTWFK